MTHLILDFKFGILDYSIQNPKKSVRAGENKSKIESPDYFVYSLRTEAQD